MERRKLIFFTSADPTIDPAALVRAYHFANVAGKAGLQAEVRLAADAVKAAKPELLADTGLGADVRAQIRAGVDGPFLVSL
ncbi:MAG: hypothetical protein ACFCVC_00160 [Acidimicrobiia bacterium]